MKKVFIDGKAGTTGLRIYERLQSRRDLELILLDETQRKNPNARKDALNRCDIAFLCLPDEAAKEAVSMIENPNVVVLDTSTAHRTAPGWAYGFPELSPAHKESICHSKRIAVPGCHASGFIALIYPLIESGILSPDALLTCHSLTGYSGGGKKMIAAYEENGRDELLKAPRQYGIAQCHKHIPEMKAITKIHYTPAFCPIVGDFYSGMEVTVPLFASFLLPGKTAKDLESCYEMYYHSDIVFYKKSADESGFYSASRYSEKDCMEISLSGSEEVLLPVARYDNLGKGASGAALECMNLVLGMDPATGLER